MKTIFTLALAALSLFSCARVSDDSAQERDPQYVVYLDPFNGDTMQIANGDTTNLTLQHHIKVELDATFK